MASQLELIIAARDEMTAVIQAAQKSVENLAKSVNTIGTSGPPAAAGVQSFTKALTDATGAAKAYGTATAQQKAATAQFLDGLKDQGLLTRFGGQLKGVVDMGLEPISTVAPKAGGALRALVGAANPAGVAIAAVGATLGLAVKQAFDLVDPVARAGEELKKMSTQTGLAVESLQALDLAASLNETSLGDVTASFRLMFQAIDEAEQGGKDALQTFDRLGVSLETLRGQTPEQQFETLAKAIAGIDDPVQRAALGVKVFGRSFQELQPILKDVAARGFSGLRQEAEDLGLVMSTDLANASDAFLDDMSRLSTVGKGFSQVIAAGLLPGVHSIVEVLLDAAKDLVAFEKETHAAQTAAEAFGITLRFVGESVNVLLAPFRLAGAAISDLGKIFGVTGGQAKLALAAVSPFTLALVAMSDAAKIAVPENEDVGLSAEDLAKKYGIAADQVGGMAAILAGKGIPALKSFADTSTVASMSVEDLAKMLANMKTEDFRNAIQKAETSVADLFKTLSAESKTPSLGLGGISTELNRALDQIDLSKFKAKVQEARDGIKTLQAAGFIDGVEASRQLGILETALQRAISNGFAPGSDGAKRFADRLTAANEANVVFAEGLGQIGRGLDQSVRSFSEWDAASGQFIRVVQTLGTAFDPFQTSITETSVAMDAAMQRWLQSSQDTGAGIAAALEPIGSAVVDVSDRAAEGFGNLSAAFQLGAQAVEPFAVAITQVGEAAVGAADRVKEGVAEFNFGPIGTQVEAFAGSVTHAAMATEALEPAGSAAASSMTALGQSLGQTGQATEAVVTSFTQTGTAAGGATGAIKAWAAALLQEGTPALKNIGDSATAAKAAIDAVTSAMSAALGPLESLGPEFKDITDQIKAAQQEIARFSAIQGITTLFEAGKISADQYQRALDGLTKQITTLQATHKPLEDTVKQTATATANAATSMGDYGTQAQNAADASGDLATTSKTVAENLTTVAKSSEDAATSVEKLFGISGGPLLDTLDALIAKGKAVQQEMAKAAAATAAVAGGSSKPGATTGTGSGATGVKTGVLGLDITVLGGIAGQASGSGLTPFAGASPYAVDAVNTGKTTDTLPTFARGGVVPGDGPMPIIAHGGEPIGPPDVLVDAFFQAMKKMGVKSQDGGSPIINNVTVSGLVVQADRDFDTLAEMLGQKLDARRRLRG